VALARLLKAELTVEMAASALEAILTRADSITVDEVLQTVSRHYDVDVPVLRGRNRSQSVAHARQVAMYLLREELHCSFPQIGEILGGRDHTTVLYGCDKVTIGIEEDDQLRRDVVSIKEQLFRSRVGTPR
jgi:chromosomal replication initiator protein